MPRRKTGRTRYDSESVICPLETCLARVNERCITVTGTLRKPHPERKERYRALLEFKKERS